MSKLTANVKQLKKEDRLHFRNVGTLLTLDDESSFQQKPNLLGECKGIDVKIKDGKFLEVGPNLAPEDGYQTIDASKSVMLPGLVDCHVHPIFAGSRATETIQKAQGATYEEIYQSGGGISKSCRLTREASNQELKLLLEKRVKNFLEQGVTTLEVKTGYGLSEHEELRQLELCLELWNEKTAMPYMVPTYLAPHGGSPEHNSLDSYLDGLIQQTPLVKSRYDTLKGANPKIGTLRFDIFIEKGYFSKAQGEKWIKEGLKQGFNAIIHADEFSESGGGQLACELAEWLKKESNIDYGKICSVDHGQFISEKTLKALAKYEIPLVLLPLTSFFSEIPYRETTKLREAGVTPVIATDFNPGSAPIQSIWLACFLALTRSKLTKEEIIRGVTIEASKALGLDLLIGKIKKGYVANCITIQGEDSDCFFDSPVGTHVESVYYT